MGLLEKLGIRKDAKPLTIGENQPDNFYQAIVKFKERPGATVKYMHRKQSGELPLYVPGGVIPMGETLEIADKIEEFIASKWGGGYWQIQILSNSQKVLATYNVGIGGPVYSSKRGRKATDGDSDQDGGAGSNLKIMDQIFLKVVDKAFGGAADPVDQMTKLATAMATLTGGPSALEGIAEHMISAQFDNGITREENKIAELHKLIELGQLFAPKVAGDDTITSLIGALPGMLQAFAMMKGAPASAAAMNPGVAGVSALPPAAGNGGVDMNSLKQLAQSLPPEAIELLPADQKAAIMQLRQSTPAGPSGASVLPRPGPAPSEVASVPAGNSEHNKVIDGMITEIRGDLAGGVPDKNIASKMITMVTYAKNFSDGAPHPVLAGVLSAGNDTGNQEFVKLCNQFPELAGHDEKIQALGAAIIELMEAGVQETNAGLGEMPGESEPGEESASLDFAYETETQREQEQEDQKNDVARSTRLSEGSEPGANESAVEEPGTGANSGDSGQIRESAADSADSGPIRKSA